jgi:hypothetical protein
MSTSRHSVGSTTWVAWLPVLFVGAMLFWTIALGLGGLSLVTVTALSADEMQVDVVIPPTATEPMPGNAASASDAILVGLQESPEPEDVNDNGGAISPAPDVIEAGP